MRGRAERAEQEPLPRPGELPLARGTGADVPRLRASSCGDETVEVLGERQAIDGSRVDELERFELASASDRPHREMKRRRCSRQEEVEPEALLRTKRRFAQLPSGKAEHEAGDGQLEDLRVRA